MNNFKEELFLKIYDDEKNRKHSLNSDQRNKIIEEVISTKIALDNEQLELEDLREGPHSTCTLSDAVEKLAFELKNDHNLYNSYRGALENEMILYMSDLAKENTTSELNEIFGDIAKGFLNKFISDIERNKKKNNSLETL